MLKDFYLFSINRLKQNLSNPILVIIDILILNWWIFTNGLIIGTIGFLMVELASLMLYYYLYITDIYNS